MEFFKPPQNHSKGRKHTLKPSGRRTPKVQKKDSQRPEAKSPRKAVDARKAKSPQKAATTRRAKNSEQRPRNKKSEDQKTRRIFMEPDLQREIEKETAENKKLLQQITKELRKMPQGMSVRPTAHRFRRCLRSRRCGASQ